MHVGPIFALRSGVEHLFSAGIRFDLLPRYLGMGSYCLLCGTMFAAEVQINRNYEVLFPNNVRFAKVSYWKQKSLGRSAAPPRLAYRCLHTENQTRGATITGDERRVHGRRHKAENDISVLVFFGTIRDSVSPFVAYCYQVASASPASLAFSTA